MRHVLAALVIGASLAVATSVAFAADKLDATDRAPVSGFATHQTTPDAVYPIVVDRPDVTVLPWQKDWQIGPMRFENLEN